MSSDKSQQKWIGVFQAEWPVQKHTLYLLNGLSDAGFYVDLFCYKTHFLHQPNDYCTGNIHIHILESPESVRIRKTILTKIRRGIRKVVTFLGEKYLYTIRNHTKFIPQSVNKKLIEITNNKTYQCLIGVEKLGLVWAAEIGEQLKVPYLYYSLELYTNRSPYTNSSDRLRRLKIAESICCQNSAAIIIQDQRRGKVLLEDNLLEGNQNQNHPLVYLPISLPGGTYGERSNYLREQFNILDNRKLILQFGQIQRYGKELIELAQTFPENYLLILHDGLIKNLWNCDSVISRLKEIDVNHKVVFSLEDLNPDQIQSLVASADIGLVLYSDQCENDKLTVLSSEKLALYLQCGLPVVAFDYPGYDLIPNNGAGVLIQQLQNIPDAIATILQYPEQYRRNAQQLFLNHYQFEHNFQAIVDFLRHLNPESERL